MSIEQSAGDIPTEPIEEEISVKISVDNLLVVEGETNDVSEITDSNLKEPNLNDQSAENLDYIPSKLVENEVIQDVVIDNYSANDIIENTNDIIETAAPEPVEKSNDVTENVVEEIPTPDETTKEDTDSTTVNTEASGITTDPDQNNILEQTEQKQENDQTTEKSDVVSKEKKKPKKSKKDMKPETEKYSEESINGEEEDVMAKSDLDQQQNNVNEIQVPNEIEIEASKELSIMEETKEPAIIVENHISEEKSKCADTENKELEPSNEKICKNSVPNNIHTSTPEKEVVPPPSKSFEPRSKYNQNVFKKLF